MSGALGRLAELVIDAFSPRDGEAYSDPMVDITEFGFGLMKVGGLMVVCHRNGCFHVACERIF